MTTGHMAAQLRSEIVGIPVTDLAAEFGTPTYIYDADRIREAEESGRRQKEMAKRAEEQECFRQLMRVHNASAASYISELLTEVIGESTAARAAAEAQQQADEGTEGPPEDKGAAPSAIVADLVDNFVFPEVQRQMEARDAAFDEQKFAHATAKALANVVLDVEAALNAARE